MNKRIILLIFFFSQFSIERIISGYPAGNAGIELTFRTKPIRENMRWSRPHAVCSVRVTGTQCCLPDVHVAVSHQRSKGIPLWTGHSEPEYIFASRASVPQAEAWGIQLQEPLARAKAWLSCASNASSSICQLLVDSGSCFLFAKPWLWGV